MKTVSTTLLNNFNKSEVRIIDKVYIYQQFNNPILTASTNIITLNGDASFLLSDDSIVFPLKSLTDEYIIESVIYDEETDITEIVITDITLDSTYIGNYLAKVVNITEKLTKKSVDSVKQTIEGKYFNEFDSGSMTAVVSNDAGYFRNKNKTGLLDGDYTFWIKYIMKFQGYDDEFIYFAGIIEISDCEPDLYNKTVSIIAYGHSYELERYPAFYLSDDENTILPKINGIKIIGYTPSDDSEEGIKEISFKPFGTSDFGNITVDSINANGTKTIRILEFKYPNLFKWDNGSWVAITTLPTDGIQKLTGKDGSSAQVIVGDGDELYDFPLKDTEMWVIDNNIPNWVLDNIYKSESEDNTLSQGKPTITFDNGTEEMLRIYFQYILRKVSSTYTDITQDINDQIENETIFSSAADELIIVSPNRFWGIDFKFNTLLSTVAEFTIHYSIGGQLWSADFSSLITDETLGFTNHGKIKWNEAGNWSSNNITIDTSTNYSGYMIKIVITSITGTSIANSIKRILRAQGENGDFIDFEADINQMNISDTTDDVIIKKDDNGDWKYAVWYYSATPNKMLTKFKEIAKYDDEDVINDSMEYNLSEPTFNIYGRQPRYSLYEYPTAFYIDFINGYIYIANKLEIYRNKMDGTDSWVKLFDLNGTGLQDTITQYMHIFSIDIYGDNVHVLVSNGLFRNGMTIYKFTYNIVTSIITDDGYNTKQYNGEVTSRYGQSILEGINKNRYIGWFSTRTPAGENLCIAYPQLNECDEWTRTVAMYPTSDEKTNTVGYPEYYFDNTADPQTLLFNSKMGFYAVQNNTSQTGVYPDIYNLTIRFGQKGIIAKRTISDVIYNYMFTKTEFAGEEVYWQFLCLEDVLKFMNSNVFTFIRHIAGHIPISMAGSLETISYWSWTEWKDFDGDVKSYSYISKIDGLMDWKYIASLDSSQVQVGFNMADSINEGTQVIDFITTNNYYTVFGHNKKLKNVLINLSIEDDTKLFEIYYWDGAQWKRNDNFLRTRGIYMNRSYYCIDIPHDWVWHSEYGYAFAIKLVSGNAYINLLANGCMPIEKVIWESQNEIGNEMQMVTNMELDSTNNVLIGSIFNRQSDHAYPFQWSLFTLKLSDTEILPDDLLYSPDGMMKIIRTGENFTFEGTFSYKNFIFNIDDSKMYAAAENLRYKDVPGFILEIIYSEAGTIVNKCGAPSDIDYGFLNNLFYYDSKLFGITKGSDYLLWEYAKDFEPRIELVKYNENDTLRTVLGDFASIMNMHYIIHSERIIRFIKRNTYNTSTNLEFDKHISKGQIIKMKYWSNKYDSVIVNWSNELNDKSGNKKFGYTGWNRKKFTLSNDLVQNKYTAKAIAEVLYNYLNTNKLNGEGIKILCMPWLEIMDAVYLIIPTGILETDIEILYEIISIELKSDKSIVLELLEIETEIE